MQQILYPHRFSRTIGKLFAGGVFGSEKRSGKTHTVPHNNTSTWRQATLLGLDGSRITRVSFTFVVRTITVHVNTKYDQLNTLRRMTSRWICGSSPTVQDSNLTRSSVPHRLQSPDAPITSAPAESPLHPFHQPQVDHAGLQPRPWNSPHEVQFRVRRYFPPPNHGGRNSQATALLSCALSCPSQDRSRAARQLAFDVSYLSF